MPDITMCANSGCPSFAKCYLAQAVPSTWQSYDSFKVPDRRVKCKRFRAIAKRPINRRDT